MSGGLEEDFNSIKRTSKHPVASSIEDVITFRLNLLVMIGERAGHQWSERLFNLSLNEWRLLALVKSRAPCRAGSIADLLLMDKSQTSRVIKSLLAKKLIQNKPDPSDGRAIVLEPTEAGSELHDRVFQEVMKSNERVLSPLTQDEVASLDSILGKLVVHTQNLLERRLGRPLAR